MHRGFTREAVRTSLIACNENVRNYLVVICTDLAKLDPGRTNNPLLLEKQETRFVH